MIYLLWGVSLYLTVGAYLFRKTVREHEVSFDSIAEFSICFFVFALTWPLMFGEDLE
jgi:hypothetical protein